MRADDLIDRRMLRRKLTFWRLAAFALVVAAIAFATQRYFGAGISATANHIAQIKITGAIVEDDELLDRLSKIRKASAVKGVIVTVDSPGGTTAGGEAIFESIRLLAEEKPVVAQIGTLATSAGYMIASAADHIVARQSSVVGSIGVLFQFPDITGLMDKIGVKLESIKSSPLKAEPSPFSPTTEEERTMIRAMILDSYDWFVDLIAERRPLSREQVLVLADGAVFTGRQALRDKLVDALGGEREARQWLVSKGVGENLEVIEWKKRQLSGGFLLPELMSRLFAPRTMTALIDEIGSGRMFLDGLVSVWQPEEVSMPD